MANNDELQRCVNILRQGGLIVAPSDTVYGLVCDATNENAVKKLIAVKNRPWGKPISVFTDGFEMIDSLTDTSQHSAILRALLPGPFTVILPSRNKVCHLLESERNTLGIRLPNYGWIQDLVHAYGRPLTATSANISGKAPHYEAEGFMNELSEAKRKLIDMVIDKGKLPRNKPSTIVDLSGDSLQLLRQGDILPLTEYSYTSNSALETKKLGSYIAEKYTSLHTEKPVVFIVEGEMGAGKTVFAQGMGRYFGVENIISPTYVVYYEYITKHNSIKTFLHADLYNIENVDEFSHLGLEDYLKKGTVMCVEWGNKIGPLFDLIKKTAHVIPVEISYKTESIRLITIKEIKE
ncbi:MAG: L-threonylcarbamoyladenylate synthase [Microgenomates group bacterium]